MGEQFSGLGLFRLSDYFLYFSPLGLICDGLLVPCYTNTIYDFALGFFWDYYTTGQM